MNSKSTKKTEGEPPLDAVTTSKDTCLIRRIYNWIFNSDSESDDEDSTTVDTPALKFTNWYIKKNGTAHHTDLYQCTTSSSYKSVVLRRGQSFELSLSFTKEILKDDRISLNFTFGPNPSFAKGTRITIPVSEESPDFGKDWSIRKVNKSNNKLDLEVFSPPTAPVGVWKLSVLYTRKEARRISVDRTDVYILFNPWCKKDQVYFEDEALLQEYILNDSGTIFTGTYKKPESRPWTFGQFDCRVLPVVMLLLEHAKIPRTERGSATKMANAISKANCLNKNSLMIERTNGDYRKGTAPFAWSSSVDIFEYYLKHQKPVGYGQCWVFSAITTTICRALGIPCRSVTNYVSANDTNGTLFVDKFFDKDGNELHVDVKDRPDTLWAFHAWNEVWMTRPDLEKDPKLETTYDGWQAVDTTPHISCMTTSCGPAPVLAICEGKVLEYNTSFFYTQVNSDLVHWVKDETSDTPYSIVQINKCHVGRMIVTKNPSEDVHSKAYLDIVESYVKADGTPEERDAVKERIAANATSRKCFEKKLPKGDVLFKLQNVESVDPGQDINVKLTASNETNEIRTANLNLAANAVYYTGHHYCRLDGNKTEIKLQPNEEQEIILNIPYEKYWSRLQEYNIVRTTAFAKIKETGYKWSDEEDFHIKKPGLTFTVKGQHVVNKHCHVEIVFFSPVNTPLTGCHLTVSCPGLKTKSVAFTSEVKPFDKLEYKYIFRPKTSGKKTITAVFSSCEYSNVAGSTVIAID